LLLPDGSLRYVHAEAHPVKGASDGFEFVGAITDVTETKLAEDKLYKAQAELAHITRLTTLGELIASIAHEVVQPLAAVVINGEVSLRLLERDATDLSEVRDALGDIIRNARRASDIIHRLRAL
jgi:C4-dicarboxylate-specific signal transduction histidine kinase